ncbi:MAG TPA: hypothetical protein VGL58_02345 [Caulobacteraceae bacterium]
MLQVQQRCIAVADADAVADDTRTGGWPAIERHSAPGGILTGVPFLHL